MKRTILLILSALFLHSICLAQEPDEELRIFANARIPASMQNFDFFETYGTFSLRQLEVQSEVLTPKSFRIFFSRNYKDVDSLSFIFVGASADSPNQAQITSMTIRFKTAAGCNNYLKNMGAPAADKRWDFVMKGENACKGVQIYKQDVKTIRIQPFSNCSG